MVSLSLTKPLTITAQPVSITAAGGDDICFSVAASGNSLTYCWQFQWPGSATWGNWVNGNTNMLYKTMNPDWDGMKVRCVITDAAGTSIESDIVTLNFLV